MIILGLFLVVEGGQVFNFIDIYNICLGLTLLFVTRGDQSFFRINFIGIPIIRVGNSFEFLGLIFKKGLMIKLICEIKILDVDFLLLWNYPLALGIDIRNIKTEWIQYILEWGIKKLYLVVYGFLRLLSNLVRLIFAGIWIIFWDFV